MLCRSLGVLANADLHVSEDGEPADALSPVSAFSHLHLPL